MRGEAGRGGRQRRGRVCFGRAEGGRSGSGSGGIWRMPSSRGILRNVLITNPGLFECNGLIWCIFHTS